MLLATAAFALTACNKESGGSASVKGKAFLYDQTNYISTYRSMRILGNGYTTENFTRVTNDNGSYFAVTNAKTLIVGVDFTDYPAADLPKGEQGTLEDLRKAVLGKSEETGWESLKSYYEKSSFGTCKIDGYVVPEWYHTNCTITEFANGKHTDGAKSNDATKALTLKVEDWAKAKGINLKDYDANEDGFIDCIIMVYSCEPHVKKSGKAVDDDLYWAFCWSNDNNASKANLENPASYRFFWASYYTFYEDGYYDESGAYHDWTKAQIVSGEAKLDAHTLIHEFGHALSLPDYYNGDYNSSDPYAYDPLGGLDMMAYNVGDHNAFSKALYGWIAPYLVYGESTVTIRSTTDTGDFIVIPTEYMYDPNKEFTLLSQYVMIEFLTPTGVAYADSLDAYAGNYPIWFSKAGVRVTHVDARMGRFGYDGKFQGITGSVSSGSGYYVRFAADNNSIERSYNKKAKIIEILSADEIAAKSLRQASNDSLYQEGDEFNTGSATSKWNNFCVNNNAGERTKKFNFGFKIEKMTKDSVTISFTGENPED